VGFSRIASAPPFCARFFAFLPLLEMVASGSDAGLRRAYPVRSKVFWRTRIYHSRRRDVIMGGMTFHYGSRGKV
jgi:hypothetical protein